MRRRHLVLLLFFIVIGLVALTRGGSNTAVDRRVTSPALLSRYTATPREAVERTETARNVSPVATVAPSAQAERRYTAQIREIMVDLGDGVDKMNDQLRLATADPSLRTDEEWQIRLAVALALIQTSSEHIRELEPPARYVVVHRTLVEAASHYERGVDFIVKGIDPLDINSLNAAAQEMNLASSKMDQAATQVQSLSTAPSGTVTKPPTPRPTPLHSPSVKETGSKVTVNQGANLRAGPGINYARVGSVTKGDVVELVARNDAGDWYQLVNGHWIAAFLVDGVRESLPVSSSKIDAP